MQNQYTGYGSPYGAMNPQQTGFMQTPGFQGMHGAMGMNGTGVGMRSQPTGMPSAMRMQSQQTGMPSMGTGMGMSSMNTGAMQPMMTGMPQRPQQSGMSNFSGMSSGTGFSSSGIGMSSQPTGMSNTGTGNTNYSFLNGPPPSSALGAGMASRLAPQITGYPGALTAQPTGMPHDPRLQMMAASLMPSNVNQPFNSSGNMQFAHPLSQPLQQSFQSLLSNPSVATPKVPWTLSRQEKKDYDQIFRAWTGGEGGGFIEGDMAQAVFGQSGLGREDLMKIWNLADINNRGKLNLPEFHVAMGLIYRALNGNEIPDTLPAELIPPSMRDIDSTVDFVKDLLRNDNSSRNTPDINLPGSYANRTSAHNKERDATNYKHDDARASGYKSSARHLDRRQVRYEGEDVSSELDSIKRDLANSSAVLDRSADEFAKRTEEDERLEQELDDLKYRVRRVKDDIEYVSRGKRTPEKDEERRKLERELMFLMHERLPEVEKKIEEREERKRQEVRDGIRARDKRNETHGRYDRYDGGRRSSFGTERERFRDDDRGYIKYEERDRDRNGRDSRDRSRDRYDSYDSRRPLSPPARNRSPPAVPAEQPKSAITAPPPAPPAPTSTRTSASSTKNMSPEERAAFIRAQAQERLQARMRALGMVVPESEPSAPTVDKSVEERMEREKKEAEEKAKQAETEQEEREAARKARLLQASEGSATPSAPAKPSASAAPLKSSMKKAPAPPPPKSRGAPATPAPAANPAPPVLSAEDEDLRAQEEAHQKAMEDRRARLQRMREEEEEAQRAEEEMLKRRQQATARKVESPAPVAPVALAEQASVPTPSLSAAVKSPPPASASTNPFHRLHNSGTSTTSPPQAASTGFNPFFRPPVQSDPVPKAAEPTSSQVEEESAPPPPPPPPPAPPAAAPAAVTRAPSRPPPAEEEWDVINEKNNDSDDSSDDDDYAGSRSMRDNLARALFGGGGSKPASKPASPAPASNKAALAKLGGGDASNVGALFAAIQGGARLKHTTTNDRSGAPVSGRVIGDAAPPAHISDVPREHASPTVPAPQPAQEEEHDISKRSANRQSVDWYSGLAADANRSAAEASGMASVVEADEPSEEAQGAETTHPTLNPENDPTGEFDMTTTLKVRSLYPYDGQRDVDLSFKENMILMAHPAKDPVSPWWYGMLLQGGKSGWFPNSYVEEIKVQQAKALFPYAGNTDEELPFAEGDTINIVDSSEADWWKAEKGGMIFIVPAAYLELIRTSQRDEGETVSAEQTSASSTEPGNTIADNNAKSSSERDTDIDSASDTSEDSVLSFDRDTPEQTPDAPREREVERQRREQERLRILESAGLHVTKDGSGQTGPRVKRRPPPAKPVNKTSESAKTAGPPLPNPVVTENRPRHDRAISRESMVSLGPDAYDRYEAYLEKAKAISQNRARSQSDVRPPSITVLDKTMPMQIGSPASSTLTLGSLSKESKLAGFMNKLSTPATPDRRSTASISGPIHIVRVDEEADDAPTHGMGPTWSSLVDAELLQNINDKERKRQEAMFEFIVTEGAYVRDLQLVVEVFYAPLLSMMDESETTAIFGNLEDILLFNTSLLSSLEDRQKACRLYIDRISDILSAQLPNLFIYKEYCMKQSQAIAQLQAIRDQNTKIASYLQTVRNENGLIRNLDLSSFLLEPMQRLTRYPLLIRQIMKYGEEPEELVQLDTALMSTERVLAEVNESVRLAENFERLRVISEDLWIGGEGRLDLTQNTAYMGPRHLLKEGFVTKAKSGRKLQLVLCNDIIVLLESRNLYRMPIPLHEAKANEGSSRDGTAFTIIQEYKRHGDTIALKATSAKDAQAWVRLINESRAAAITEREAWVRQNRRRSGIGY
ncbi:hypothetical protein NliqN6_2592 [Naganishia liquefaciens]|uniref:Actin cytoskeleton-regulatory complex protein PAN1 n=1 Tax=Naganishia liquefaciens TaxID=104408 RepID=A0A8H3TT58_9TREE|nr:hypothetical protein NliqN6_2592 [Naganishia liquefaciens]